MFAAIAKHSWITGHERDLSVMNSFYFRPEKCKQHHFFEWRLGPMGWRWGKHVHSCTLSTEQLLQVTYCPPSLSEQHWWFSFNLSFCKQLFHGEPLGSLRTLMTHWVVSISQEYWWNKWVASLVQTQQDLPYPTPRVWTTTWCVSVFPRGFSAVSHVLLALSSPSTW